MHKDDSIKWPVKENSYAGEWPSTYLLQQKNGDGLYRLTTIIPSSSNFFQVEENENWKVMVISLYRPPYAYYSSRSYFYTPRLWRDGGVFKAYVGSLL